MKKSQLAYGLTAQEMRIIHFLCDGLSNREIGDKLGTKEVTVKRQMSNLCDKIGASSRLEVAMFAVSKGLVDVRGDRPDRDELLVEIEKVHRRIERYVGRSRVLVQRLSAETKLI